MREASFSGIFKPAAPATSADVVLLGAPHEMAASLSPCTERGEDLSGVSGLAAIDAGDLELPGPAPEAWRRIDEAVGRVVASSAVPFVLGGDHAVTVPAFTAVQRRYPNVHLLYLDAHPDLYPEYGGDPCSHACVVARILELHRVVGRRITQVGIRASNPAQRAVAEAAGIRTVHAWEVDDFVYQPLGPVYLSVDVDVLDPAHAPGCGNPVPAGLSTRQLLRLLQSLEVELVGVDVVEVNPLLDPSGITALAAARVVTETLGVMAKRLHP